MSITTHLIAEFPVRETTREALAVDILDRMTSAEKSLLFFANTNFIVQCRGLLDDMRSDNVIIVNDGVGMDIAALLLHRKKFKSNLNGTDFTPYLFSQTKQPLRVFMLGGKPEVLDKASDYLTHNLGQIVVGSCDGYGGINEVNLVSRINVANPDVILVAMGNPMQERWILNHYQELNARLITGVGALFDFWAGNKPRAPTWVQKLKLEWLFRLCLEPKRLMKRYTIDVLVFLTLCIKHK